jgi:hypothetical protein
MAVKPISSMMNVDSDKIMGYDKYLVKNAVETLQRAKEINNDPGFMKAVEVEAQRQVDALRGIAGKKVSTPKELRGHGAAGI